MPKSVKFLVSVVSPLEIIFRTFENCIQHFVCTLPSTN